MRRIRKSIALIAATLLSVVIVLILLCVVVLQLVLMGDDFSVAHYDAAAAVKAALDRDDRGMLVVNENSAKANTATPALPAIKSMFPDFWFVASDGRSMVRYGPVPDRVLATLPHGDLGGAFSEFVVNDDGPMRVFRSAIVTTSPTGTILIDLGGAAYSQWQIFTGTVQDMVMFIIPTAAMLVGTIVAGIIIVPILIARPVRRVAAAAEYIDGTREGARLPEASAPVELIPMVAAFNRALARIDATAAEQRRFLSSAAHELRTPLARARTRLESLDDGALKSALVADVQTLSSIVTMLLQLARLSSSPGAYAEVDLVKVAQRVAAEHAPAALKSGIEIEFSAPTKSIEIPGSEQAIDIALSNVFRNAVQHTRRGQRVSAEVLAPATVRIIDHGPGIAIEDRSAVLEPYVRRRDDNDGTGLGLAIVAQVMALHNGRVAIDETPGGGTTVSLVFPPR